jgi:hypothetical protein
MSDLDGVNIITPIPEKCSTRKKCINWIKDTVQSNFSVGKENNPFYLYSEVRILENDMALTSNRQASAFPLNEENMRLVADLLGVDFPEEIFKKEVKGEKKKEVPDVLHYSWVRNNILLVADSLYKANPERFNREPEEAFSAVKGWLQDGDGSCPICLREGVTGRRKKYLPCGHWTCSACYKDIVERPCPMKCGGRLDDPQDRFKLIWRSVEDAADRARICSEERERRKGKRRAGGRR